VEQTEGHRETEE
jgi:hypothetical protein